MRIRQACKEHAALLVAVGAFILIFGAPSLFIGFYGDHGFRYPHTEQLEPNPHVGAFSDFFIDNYKYFFTRLVSDADLAIHLNRMLWFVLSGVSVYAVSYFFWEGNKLAGLLAATIYLSYPVLSSQRLWSVGFAGSIAVFFACLSIVFELKILKIGFSFSRRACAFLFFFLSIYVLEFFAWIPVIAAFAPVRRFLRDRRVDLRNVLSIGVLYVPLMIWLYLWETRAGRKAGDGLIPDLSTLDVNRLLQDFWIPVYQLVSGNIGKGFATFLLQVAALAPDIRNAWEVSLGLFWIAVVCLSTIFVLRTSRFTLANVRQCALLSAVWICLSAVVVALGGMKGGSNGYIADRVNGGLSSGAAFMFSGLFILGVGGRGRTRVISSIVVLGLFLFLTIFSCLLQLRDWRYLGDEEEGMRIGLKASGLAGEVRPEHPILLSGVRHVLSSFPHKSNPNFSGAHVYSDYRFTPLSLHERWPDAAVLSGRLDAALYRVDAFHRVQCLNDALLLERPVGIDGRDGGPFTKDKHDDLRMVRAAIYMRKEADGRFSVTRVDASNCVLAIPGEFRVS